MPDLHDANAFRLEHKKAPDRQNTFGPRMLAYTWYSAKDSALSPIDSSRIEYTSKYTTQVQSLLHFRFQEGNWHPYDRYLYFYDAQGGNIQTDYQFWSKNGDSFQNFIRYNYSVNSNGVATDLLYQIWDNASSSYLNGIFEHYDLNARDQRMSRLQRFWDKNTQAWNDYLQETNTYSNYGQLQEQVLQYWNSTLSLWEFKKRYVWSFSNPTGHQDADTTYEWENFHHSWMPNECHNYTLNHAHQPSFEVRELFLPGVVGWYSVSQTSSKYNPSGSLSSELLQTWDSSSMSFVNNSNTLHSYNKSGQQIVNSTMKWNGTAWAVGDNANQSYFYYEPALEIPTSESTTLEIILSPLPANTSLQLRVGKETDLKSFRIFLFDMQGREIELPVRSVSQSLLSASVENLPEGMYLLQAKSPSGTIFTWKLPVKH
ncbi:MAG: hypothetical protein JST06_01390 [Bacteroidetes bacterium]|nr:hypothetical protein [Bacteroidota bacterium]MBS1630578.1 hypothetical protein [Bacteroidota bacterium]